MYVKSCLTTGATNTVTRMKDPPKRGERIADVNWIVATLKAF